MFSTICSLTEVDALSDKDADGDGQLEHDIELAANFGGSHLREVQGHRLGCQAWKQKYPSFNYAPCNQVKKTCDTSLFTWTRWMTRCIDEISAGNQICQRLRVSEKDIPTPKPRMTRPTTS